MTTCQTCGSEHSEWPSDIGFQRPDVVWKLEFADQNARVKANNDVCILDDSRHFLRGVLYVPVHGTSQPWGIGIWVEVSKQDFDRYCDLFNADASKEPRFPGIVSNALRAFPEALSSMVEVQLGRAADRPSLFYDVSSETDLAQAQNAGLSDAELHRVFRIEKPDYFSGAGA